MCEWCNVLYYTALDNSKVIAASSQWFSWKMVSILQIWDLPLAIYTSAQDPDLVSAGAWFMLSAFSSLVTGAAMILHFLEWVQIASLPLVMEISENICDVEQFGFPLDLSREILVRAGQGWSDKSWINKFNRSFQEGVLSWLPAG